LGEPCPLDYEPRLWPENIPYLEAFEQLAKRRPEGFASTQPIPIAEIRGWAEIFWPLELERFVARMLALDAAHRDWLAERAENETDARDQSKARPQGNHG
jgi:hypothetical protein